MAQSCPASHLVVPVTSQLTIFELPDDVLAVTISFLRDLIDVAALACSCRRLRQICQRAPLRLHISESIFQSSSNEDLKSTLHATLASLCCSFPGTFELDLSSLPLSSDSVSLLVERLPGLSELRLAGCKKLTGAAVTAVAAKASLRSIDFLRCFQLQSVALTELIAASRTPGNCLVHVALSHLDLSLWSNIITTARGGTVEMHHSPSTLRALSLHNSSCITASVLSTLAASCPELEILCLGGCASILCDLPCSKPPSAVVAAADDDDTGSLEKKQCPLRAALITTVAHVAAGSTPCAALSKPIGAYSTWLHHAALELAVTALHLPQLRVLELTFCPPGLASTVRQVLHSIGTSSAGAELLENASALFDGCGEGEGQNGQQQTPIASSSSRAPLLDPGRSSSRAPPPYVWDFCDPHCVELAQAWHVKETRAWWRRKHEDCCKSCHPGQLTIDPGIVTSVLRAAVRCSSPARVTPLHFACSEDSHGADVQFSHVNDILALGGEVGARDRNGATPLFLSCEAGHVAVADRLLTAGADPTAHNAAGEAPLYIAALRGHAAVVDVLLRHCRIAGVKWDDSSLYDVNNGWTPLHAGCLSGGAGIVAQLLVAAGPAGAGTLVRSANRYGQTCVHIAARKGSPELIRALLDAGGTAAALDRDCERRTAADVAYSNGNYGALRMLLCAQSDATLNPKTLKSEKGAIGNESLCCRYIEPCQKPCRQD